VARRSRRRTSKTSSTTGTTSTESTASQSSTTSRSTTRRSTTRKTRRVDTDRWVSSHIDTLIERLGLDTLPLKQDELQTILTKIVDMLRGDAATINIDTIVRRFHRNLEEMYKIIAVSILELRDELDPETLEFVVNNIGDHVLAFAPRLYREAKKYGRDDLVERLRAEWARAWITHKKIALPVQCPKCGFNSLMPDLSCVVCGASTDEKELKEYLGFEKLLREFVELYPREDVEKAIKYGYVLLNSMGIKPPTAQREPLDIEIVLSSSEIELLKSLLQGQSNEHSTN